MHHAKSVRWGILSTARIGTKAVIPSLQRTPRNEVVAIGSRTARAAAEVAGRFGIARAHGSYEALLADPDVDAVYIPLPNHLHVPWTRRALEAGKHVLCEKPLARTAAEAARLRDEAAGYPHLHVMEAFMYRFHPQWARVQEIAASGQIGTLRSVHAHFSYFNADPSNIRNQPGIGGGGLLDVGCYCVSAARLVFGEEPTRVAGAIAFDPAFGVDRLASGLLEFGAGVATFTCGTQLFRRQHVLLCGTDGEIEVPLPFNPTHEALARLVVRTADGERAEETAAVSPYDAQAEAFAAAVLDGTPLPVTLDDAVANLAVLDALVRSAETGTRQAVP